jgi:dATP pyrophosphohydrolase
MMPQKIKRAPFQVLVVPFRKTTGGHEFAALKRSDMCVWQFVAGGGDEGEPVEQAARREASEELGLPVQVVIRLQSMATVPVKFFKARSYWPQDLYVVPEYAFAADCTGQDIRLSGEHHEVVWGNADQIMTLLNWDSNRTALWELGERLRRS